MALVCISKYLLCLKIIAIDVCFCFCSDDEVANAASETIKSLARFPDAMVCV